MSYGLIIPQENFNDFIQALDNLEIDYQIWDMEHCQVDLSDYDEFQKAKEILKSMKRCS